MEQVFIGLGSNLGDRQKNLKSAIDALIHGGLGNPGQLSKVYLSEPWGPISQRFFLNQVLELHTDCNPHFLLHQCQSIENRLGRKKTEQWGPRIIDIDILLYGQHVVYDQDLHIPHPRIHERRFVLVPLAEIAPEFTIPNSGKTVRETLVGCFDRKTVQIFSEGSDSI